MRGREREKRSFRGVITVEMSYLIPMVLLLFLLVVYTVFYYHDKNILIGAASETAAAGAQLERRPDKKGQGGLEDFFQERIRGKLVLFSGAQVSADVSKKWVEINAHAENRGMRVHIFQRAAVTNPEKAIRRKRILENITHKDDGSTGSSENQNHIENPAGIEGGGSAVGIGSGSVGSGSMTVVE